MLTIGCKLPHGLVIETGIAKNGSPSDDYKAYVLNGLAKAPRGAKFGRAQIPDDVWATWVKKNALLRYVVDKSVFVVP